MSELSGMLELDVLKMLNTTKVSDSFSRLNKNLILQKVYIRKQLICVFAFYY